VTIPGMAHYSQNTSVMYIYTYTHTHTHTHTHIGKSEIKPHAILKYKTH